jgi:O-antigen biosynthesis protein
MPGNAAEPLPGRGGGSTVPILMYHQVTPAPIPAFSRYTITAANFERQMRWLALAGYHPVTIGALVASRRGGAALPPRPVVITFDDGFEELLHHAVPVLQRRGFTATIFLIAGLMGGEGEWLRDEIGTAIPIMGWDSARGLDAAGFELGAHTVSHPRLTSLEASAVRSEVADGRKLLEDRLGRAVTHFAYPFGAYDRAVRQAVIDAGYESACSTRRGRSPGDDDLFALHRVSVYGHDSMASFICRLLTAQSPRELLRGKAGGPGAGEDVLA